MCVVNLQNRTFELTSRSLLLASCNRYRLVVGFINTCTKQKWQVLNPPVNRETLRKIQLTTGCTSTYSLGKEDYWLVVEKKGSQRSGLRRRKGTRKEKGEDPG